LSTNNNAFGTDGIAEAFGRPLERPDVSPRVGIQKKLVGVKPMAGGRLMGSMHSKPVDRGRIYIRE
jgi:hypothetical protein